MNRTRLANCCFNPFGTEWCSNLAGVDETLEGAPMGDIYESPPRPRVDAAPNPAADQSDERRWLAWSTGASIVVALAMRLVDLAGLPGEMYGDITIVRDYVDGIRAGHWLTDFILSSGPLYHYVIVPITWVFGVDFNALKTASVIVSLIALAATYALARELVDRTVAMAALFIAGASSWLLIFSRLGNSQIITPVLGCGTVYFAVRAARRDDWRSAALCGAVAALGLYGYPQTFVLAPVMFVTLLVLHVTVNLRWRLLGIFTAAAIATGLPFAVIVSRHPQDFLDGYIGGKIHARSGAFSTLLDNLWHTMFAFHIRGDSVFRSNPSRLPHLDALSGLLFLIGLAWWLAPARRRWAPALLLPLVLFQVPAMMVLGQPAEVPSASRTLTAAPLAYVVTASGLCWLAGAVHPRALARRTITGLLLGLILLLNGTRYFGAYADGLPNHNVPFGRIIADHLARLPTDTHAFIVGCCWGEHGQPEPKGILYLDAGPVPEHLVQLNADTLDCVALSELPRPAELIWKPDTVIPAPGLAGCTDQFIPELHGEEDVDVFYSATLRSSEAAG